MVNCIEGCIKILIKLWGRSPAFFILIQLFFVLNQIVMKLTITQPFTFIILCYSQVKPFSSFDRFPFSGVINCEGKHGLGYSTTCSQFPELDSSFLVLYNPLTSAVKDS